MSKLIKNASDKKQAIVAATGLVALARLIEGFKFGYEEGVTPKQFLDTSAELGTEFVERIIASEKQ